MATTKCDQPSKPRNDRVARSRWIPWSLLGLAVLFAGCRPAEIDATYGRRRGASGGHSINGTAVLSSMFRQAGHRVSTKKFLSPKINSFDIIVWAPDDFGPPSSEVEAFFESWLQDGVGRTLIYIGRDYDAEPYYWEMIQSKVPVEQAIEVHRRLARARAEHSNDRIAMPRDDKGQWFKMARDAKHRSIGVSGADGDAFQGEWARQGAIDASKVSIELHGRLERLKNPPLSEFGGVYRDQTLLASDGDLLVRRITSSDWDEGQILVVANGSFLLNLPLVNHENVKIAGKLIEQCGPATRVCFLESGQGGPLVLTSDPGSEYQTGLEMFTIWPIGPILLHFLALGILFIMSRFAIFGHPIQWRPVGVSDFGNHIRSLGQLLGRTGRHGYAKERLDHYREHDKRDSGTAHKEKTEPAGP